MSNTYLKVEMLICSHLKSHVSIEMLERDDIFHMARFLHKHVLTTKYNFENWKHCLTKYNIASRSCSSIKKEQTKLSNERNTYHRITTLINFKVKYVLA